MTDVIREQMKRICVYAFAPVWEVDWQHIPIGLRDTDVGFQSQSWT